MGWFPQTLIKPSSDSTESSYKCHFYTELDLISSGKLPLKVSADGATQ